MIDFLFLMLSLFATLAISRSALFDTEVNLAELKPEKEKNRSPSRQEIQKIHLSINASGNYKWLTEFHEYPMDNVQTVQDELSRQYKIGALAQEKAQTEVLLHIDKKAPWESIAQMIFAIRELGFGIYPVYEPLDSK